MPVDTNSVQFQWNNDNAKNLRKRNRISKCAETFIQNAIVRIASYEWLYDFSSWLVHIRSNRWLLAVGIEIAFTFVWTISPVASTVVDKQNNCIKLILIQFKMEKDEISTCIPLLISYIRFNGNEMNSVWRCFHTIRTQYGRNMANRGHAEENKAIYEHNSTNRNSAKIEFEMCLYASWAILCKCSHKYIFFSCFVHMVIHNHVMINVRCRETSNTSPNCQQQQ